MYPAEPYDFSQADSGKILIAGRLLVVGVSVRETTGAAVASVLVADSGNPAIPGLGVIPFNLAASESVRDWFWPGIIYSRGVQLTITGTCSGSVFVVPESLLDSNHWVANLFGIQERGERVI